MTSKRLPASLDAQYLELTQHIHVTLLQKLNLMLHLARNPHVYVRS